MTFEQRLARLERQNRWLKGGVGALLLAVATACLLGSVGRTSVADLVEARAFHVIGKDGKVLVKIEDTHGKGLGAVGTITTLDGEGRDLITMSARKDGLGQLKILNSAGRSLIELGATPGGQGLITTSNGTGQQIVRLTSTTEGNGALSTLNSRGQNLIELGVLANGEATLRVHDPSGQKRATVLMPDGR